MRYKIDPLTGGLLPAQNDSTVSISSSTGGSGIVESIVAGANVIVDSTDQANPIVSATGGGGTTDHSALSNLDYASAGHTGFQPAGAYLTDISGQDLSTANNTTSAFITAGDIPAIPDSVDDLSPSQTGNNGKFLKTNGTTATWESIPGGGDMLAATYDPAGGAGQVAFASDLGTAAAADTTDFAPALGDDDNYVTDTEKSNLHAPGSDNQDLSGLVPYTGASSDVDLGANSADVSSLGVNKDHSADNGIEILNKSGKQGLRIENPAETDISFSTYKTADDYVRFTFLGDGKMEWGSGAVVADTNLYRSAANTLKTDDNFVANNISAGATVSGANTGDQDLSGYALTTRKLDDFGTPDNNTDLDANTTNHGLLLKATAPAAGLINVVGIANGETSYANKALFDTTDPTACILGNSADDGTATVAARRDHQHAMPTLTTMYNLFYPVGCIYTTTVSTNPGTLFGVGTWEAFGEGRVLVGKAGSGTFNTAGATGGVETVTLTAAQSGLPAHTHGDGFNTSAGKVSAGGAVGTRGSTAANTAANAAEAHTNLQPYIVVYMWKRTA